MGKTSFSSHGVRICGNGNSFERDMQSFKGLACFLIVQNRAPGFIEALRGLSKDSGLSVAF